MEFMNEPVSIDNIPRVEDVSLKPIEKKYLSVLRLEWLTVTIICFAGATGLIWSIRKLQQPLIIEITAAVLVLFSALYFIIQERSFQFKAYAIRERDIVYRKGWIIRSVSVCPFNRVQHSAVTAGPYERKYGLATIVLYTAGTSDADLRVRGLREEEAHSLKEWITKKISNEEQPGV